LLDAAKINSSSHELFDLKNSKNFNLFLKTLHNLILLKGI